MPPASGISQADADLRYVNTAGDTMTGALTTTQLNAPAVVLVGSSGTDRRLMVYTAGVPRWYLGGNAAPETGSDAGSDLDFYDYGDAGNIKSTVLKLSRATGAATFGGGVTVNGSAGDANILQV